MFLPRRKIPIAGSARRQPVMEQELAFIEMNNRAIAKGGSKPEYKPIHLARVALIGTSAIGRSSIVGPSFCSSYGSTERRNTVVSPRTGIEEVRMAALA